MSAHTPGQWRVLDAEVDKEYMRIRGTRIGGRYKVANVHAPKDILSDLGENIANARLIAAAPELLEALIAIRDRNHTGDAWALVNSAISKATGGAQ